MSRTILNVLTAPRDELDSSKVKKSSANKRNKNYLHTDEIQDWVEFTFENVHLAFKEFLDQPVPDSFQEGTLPSIKQPEFEVDIKIVFLRFTTETVTGAVKVVMDRFPGLFPPGRVEMLSERNVYKPDDIQLPDTASKQPASRTHNNFPLTAYSHKDIITWHRVAGQHGAGKGVKYRNKFSGLMHPYSELRKHKHLILLEAEDY
ncbi:hypothetical protein BJ166DRAFT_503231 [Pestalotiopsis sp. NC0098]|nr:hypothetical protein BJ166DRAFT_503231 [Pestalotiopsis sp. NC0098]